MERIDQYILDNYEVVDRLELTRRECFWKCIDKNTKQNVAIKLYEDFDLRNQMGAILLTEELRHENIRKIQKIIKGQEGTSAYVVYEYMEMNISQLLRKEPICTDHNIRYILYQLLKAVKLIHSADLILLNLSPESVLIDENFKVKLTRFGNFIYKDEPKKAMTITYFTPRKEAYYAPELILRSTTYTSACDMWAVGCILGELLLRRPLFMGLNLSGQLRAIIEFIGQATDEDLDSVEAPDSRGMLRNSNVPHVPVSQKFSSASKEALDLLQKLLHVNPKKRISAAEALKHPYLAEFYGTEKHENFCPKITLPDITSLKTEELADKLIQEFNDRRR